ncbi:Acetyltransferase (GNAT) domain-containing protein [Modestobacter sp. DSM 44400]|nr:Acetyltransferase (GNAT) domain-containing protein [Modestobacter sp. DSM 44400]
MELLCTDRLRLRAWTAEPGDLDRLTDLYGREEVTRWLDGPPTVPAAELVQCWAAVRALDPLHGCWAIAPLDGGPPAGTVLFKPLPDGVGEVEVGWHLHRTAGAAGTPRRQPAPSSTVASMPGSRRSAPSSGRATSRRWGSAGGWA